MSSEPSKSHASPARRAVTDHATHPNMEPLVSLFEYQDRLRACGADMTVQLNRLGPPWCVAGIGRLEAWGGAALVVGPPGIFLVWPISGHPEPILWIRAAECRDHLQNGVGRQWPGIIGVVFFSTHGDGLGGMTREIYSDDRYRFNVLLAHGRQIDVLLMSFEPASGVFIADDWLAEFARQSEPRWDVHGPSALAMQTPLIPDHRI